MWTKVKTWLKQRVGVEDGPVYGLAHLGRFNLAGVCLWPIGIFVNPNMNKTVRCVIAHEQHHWDWQRKTLGLWYVAYLLLLPFGAGRKHLLEKSAYQVEDRCSGGGAV